MAKKRFEVDVPDGQHLGEARDSGGAFRGLAFDDKTGKLVGHVELREVLDRPKKRERLPAPNDGADGANQHAGRAESYELDGPDSQPTFGYVTDADAEPSTGWGELLGAAVVLGVAVAAARGLQRAQSRADDDKRGRPHKRSKQKPGAGGPSSPASLPRAPASAPAGWYPDPHDAGRLLYWDGNVWTGHAAPNPVTRPGAVPAIALPAAPTRPVTVAHREPTVSMSADEWQQRLRAMLLARAFSEEQLWLLSHAQIEDASPALSDFQRALAQLTPHELSHRIQLMLEANPEALTDAEAEFLRTFGVAREVAGKPSWEGRPGTDVVRGAAERAARSPAPPGWYGDGQGQHRWWDGQRWTHHVQVTQYANFEAPRVPIAAGWYNDGSGRMRWWDGQRWM